jgi:hypothetical protein
MLIGNCVKGKLEGGERGVMQPEGGVPIHWKEEGFGHGRLRSSVLNMLTLKCLFGH